MAGQHPRSESHRPHAPRGPPPERLVAGLPVSVDRAVAPDEIIELAVGGLHGEDEPEERDGTTPARFIACQLVVPKIDHRGPSRIVHARDPFRSRLRGAYPVIVGIV